MSVPVTPNEDNVELTVEVRHVQRRWTDDGWWEHLDRNPETGVETWVRYKRMHAVEIAMRDAGLRP